MNFYPRTFTKIYLDFDLDEGQLTDKEFRLFILLSLKMYWLNNTIQIDDQLELLLKEKLNLTGQNSLRKLLYSLTNKGFLERTKQRTYKLNTKYTTRQTEPGKKKEPYNPQSDHEGI